MVRRCTYPSIHFFVSRSRSVVDCAWCGMCGVRVVCVRACVCACACVSRHGESILARADDAPN